MNDVERRIQEGLRVIQQESQGLFHQDPAAAKVELTRRLHRRRLGVWAGSLALGGAAVTAVLMFSAADGPSPRPPLPPAGSIAPEASIEVGDAPVDLAVGGLGYMWVANTGDSSLSRIDPSTNEVIDTVALPGPPGDIAIGEGPVWVSIPSRGSVALVDTGATPPVADEIRGLPEGAGIIELTTDAAGVWALLPGEAAFHVDLSGAVEQRDLVDAPIDIATKGQTLFLLDATSGEVARLDAVTGKAVGAPYTIQGCSRGDLIYAANALWCIDDGVLIHFDPVSKESTAVELEVEVIDLAIDPTAAWVLVRRPDGSHGLTAIDRLAATASVEVTSIPARAAEASIADGSVWVAVTDQDRVVRYPKSPDHSSSEVSR